MRTVTVELKVRLFIDLDNTEDVENVINEMYYIFQADTEHDATIIDSSIEDFFIVELKIIL